MQRSTKILRLLTICLIALFFVWFGSKFSQPVRPAYGEIFKNLAEPLLDRERGLATNRAGENDWRISRINSNLVRYKVSQTSLSVTDLFNSLEKSTPSWPGRVVAASQANEELGRDYLFSKAVFSPRVFRNEWQNWGVLGLLHSDPLSEPSAGSSDENRRPNGLLAVMAFRDGGEQRTTYLTFVFDEDFDPHKLARSAGKDAPGKDAPDVPRYPGDRRDFTVEEDAADYESLVAVYSGRGNFFDIANFYRGSMANLGWTVTDLPSTENGAARSGDVLYFVKKDRECAIYPANSSQPGILQTVISYRRTH